MLSQFLMKISAWSARKKARNAALTSRMLPIDGGIGAEAPIKSQDQDRLRRADFAERIATVLASLSPTEGRVFAIRGGWGFGKSSLKNLVTERLDGNRTSADWLDFNPWQWGDGDSIARALFSQIADRLGGEQSKEALARAEALRRYGKILTGVAEPLEAAGRANSFLSLVLTNASVIAISSAIGFDLPAVATIAGVLSILAVALPYVGRVFTYLGKDQNGDSLDKIRSRLETRLRTLGKPLVVFVDDIDRLEQEQIRLLLRHVKANANLPNIIFVLLFQPSIVEAALNSISATDGRAFLEKIVQTNFDLPEVTPSVVHHIFTEELSALVGAYATEENGFSPTNWGNAFVGCIQPMLRNIRDARRLLSSVEVHLPLHLDGEVCEVNIIDFLVLEALRVFEPALHRALFSEKELLLQVARVGRDRRGTDRAAAEKLLETVAEARRNVAKDSLKLLFPSLEWAYGGNTYADGFQQKWLNEKRICSGRYFARYFELQIGIGEISERRFVQFLEASETAGELDACIKQIESDGLLRSLAERLDESVGRLPVQKADVLLPGMFQIAQIFSAQKGTDPFNSPWLYAWRATSWFLKRIPEASRADLVLSAFRQTQGLSISAMLIHLSDPLDNADTQNFEPALTPETVTLMKAEWLAVVRSQANGGGLISDPDLISLLYRWRDFSGSFDEPRRFVTEQIVTTEGFGRVVTLMMSRGSTHTSGDRVSTIHVYFQREVIEDFLGIDRASERLDAINLADFPEFEQPFQSLKSHIELWQGRRQAGPLD